MRNRQNILRAGIAAIALISTTGLVLAQQSPVGQGNDKSTAGTSSAAPSQQSMTPNASSAAGDRAGGTAAGMSRNDQKSGTSPESTTEKDTAAVRQNGSEPSSASTRSKSDRSAESVQHGNNASQQRNRMSEDQNQSGNERRGGLNETRSSQREEQRGHISVEQRGKSGSTSATMERGRTSTVQRAQRDSRLKGLHADTTLPLSGENVRLTGRQRSRIRETVIEGRDAPRVGHIDFDLRVGSTVPRRDVRIVPVPETLVGIDPEWRGYLYFVYEDEVVIVNPRNMRIVAVLDV